jgi:hypothetical protein
MRKMKKAFAAFVTLVVFSGSAVGAALPPAHDPATVAAVKDMLVAMNYRELVQSRLLFAFAISIKKVEGVLDVIKGSTDMSAEAKLKKLARLQEAIAQFKESPNKLMSDPVILDALTAEMVPVFARTYTAAEIQQMAAFYRTPVGQKMLASTPHLTAEGYNVIRKVLEPQVEKLGEQVGQVLAE